MKKIESWIIIAVAAFFAAGIVKGTLGMGLPAVSIALMTQFIDPRTAIALVVFPIMLSNYWQAYRSGQFIATLQKYAVFAGFLFSSLILTTFFTSRVSSEFLVGLVGFAIVAFALTNLAFRIPAVPERFDRLAQISGGIGSGILGGFTAIWSPPIAAYLVSKQAEKDEFVRATGLLFSVGSFPLCVGFLLNGMLTTSVSFVSAAMIIPSLIGFSLGEVIRAKLNPQRFKKLILIFFLLIGLNLIRKALFAG